jgi:hypothetical protein
VTEVLGEGFEAFGFLAERIADAARGAAFDGGDGIFFLQVGRVVSFYSSESVTAGHHAEAIFEFD